MLVAITAIVVALIGGPLMVFMRRFDARNTDQHAANSEVLQAIREDIREVRVAQIEHLQWHGEIAPFYTPTPFPTGTNVPKEPVTR